MVDGQWLTVALVPRCQQDALIVIFYSFSFNDCLYFLFDIHFDLSQARVVEFVNDVGDDKE